MPTGSLRHKEYLSDKIHNILSFSLLKCLQFCSWSQGCGWTIPIREWKEECGKHSIKLELEAAAHDWQPETLLENQCSQGMHRSWKSSRQPQCTAASGWAEELQQGVSALSPWEGKVEKATQGIGIFFAVQRWLYSQAQHFQSHTKNRADLPGDPLWYDTKLCNQRA